MLATRSVIKPPFLRIKLIFVYRINKCRESPEIMWLPAQHNAATKQLAQDRCDTADALMMERNEKDEEKRNVIQNELHSLKEEIFS
jgi:hypothetical protein